MKKYIIYIFFTLTFTSAKSQLLLDADGPGNTYELITSKLAPGYDAVEEPDCNHAIFGRHIDEVYDATLNTNVFRFHIHVNEDDDRCINFDRQRNEIKTYASSPDSLKGIEGEQFDYQWKFKLDANFQSSSSFTHIHQLKAVGGTESSMPLITLTTRKGSPDKLQLRYAETTSQITLAQVDLSPFKGEWVNVVETVLYGETGTYSITITKVSDGTTLFSYSNNSIRMWKTDASFIRPKWGIYRSLNNPLDLRDEVVLFANFRIQETIVPTPVELTKFTTAIQHNTTVMIEWKTVSEISNNYFEVEKSKNGIDWLPFQKIDGAGNSLIPIHYQTEDKNPFGGISYYRLKQVDFNGDYYYSDISKVDLNNNLLHLYPNPSKDVLIIEGIIHDIHNIKIYNINGSEISRGKFNTKIINNNLELSIENLALGMYFITINDRTYKFYKY